MSNGGQLLNASPGTYQSNANVLVTQPYTIQTGTTWLPQQPVYREPEPEPDLSPLAWLRAQVDEITELAAV